MESFSTTKIELFRPRKKKNGKFITQFECRQKSNGVKEDDDRGDHDDLIKVTYLEEEEDVDYALCDAHRERSIDRICSSMIRAEKVTCITLLVH